MLKSFGISAPVHINNAQTKDIQHKSMEKLALNGQGTFVI